MPPCDKLIPPALLAKTPPAELPEARQLADGHDDAQPWQIGFFEQTGQLEKADEKAPAVNWIYRNCLEMHREQQRRSERGFFGRLFG